jgi:acyl dehydratase
MTDVYFEDVEVGLEIPQLTKGPLTTAHIMRWSAAMENWHRIHFDQEYTIQHDKLPGIMVNGSWKQNFLIQLLADWAGETGWLWKLKFQFRGMNIAGETLVAWGKVKSKQDTGDFGVVEIDVGLVNNNGIECTPGTATVVLQKRGGRAVPYPFDPKVLGPAAISPAA